MKAKPVRFLLFIMLGLFLLLPNVAFGAPAAGGEPSVKSWELLWETAPALTGSPDLAAASVGWQTVSRSAPVKSRPKDIPSAWIRLRLPQLPDNSGVFFPSVYGQEVTVYLDGEVLFHSERHNVFDTNRVLIALKGGDAGKDLYIHLKSVTDRIGLAGEFHFGNYQDVLREYAKKDLVDIIIGSAYIFVAFVMLVCSVFLERQQLKIWLSLCFIILPIGGLMIGFSPFLYTFYGKYGAEYQYLFDLSLYMFLPAMMMFFEQLFGSGRRRIVTHFRRFLIGYSLFGLTALLVNILTNKSIETFYSFISVSVVGVVMLVQFLLMFVILVLQLWKRNIDSIIMAIGLVVFTAIGVTELILFYSSSQTYSLSWWKWGLIAFVLSLIIVLGRRFAHQHKLIVSYSRDLEIYNTELQRSEKMEIISQLAASVAHEVRNPLQVTRGLLQILGKKNEVEPGQDDYHQLAIDELDRASVIITDFLTFAKPQIELVDELNLAEEFKHVEGIIVPLANLQGGRLEVTMPRSLRIMGNSSKLKQAIINIIKNSIEALEGSGLVRVWAYEEHEQVVIHIADSGGGMDERMIERLGEPYFSNKTKGTGLGLMVTFRIIEAMRGTITFRSEKGVGTEATIRFPAARVIQQNAKVGV